MRSFQQAPDKIVRQRIGKELVAHVAARMNGPVDGLSFLDGKRTGPDEKIVRFVVHRQIPNNAQPPAVRAGNLLFISGMTAGDKRGQIVGPGDIAAQTRYIFEKLARLLAE